MRMPMPPEPRMTMTTRTKVAWMSRYSSRPPHTPPMTRLVRLRSRRPDTSWLPSDAALVNGREDEAGEGRGRDRRIGRRTRERHEALRRASESGEAEAEETARIDIQDCRQRGSGQRGEDPEADPDEGQPAREPNELLSPAPPSRGGHDGRGVEPRRLLVRVEPQRPAEGRLRQRVDLGHVVHTPGSASALRSSCRARSSWTPMVEDGRASTPAISSTLSSLK